MQNIPPLPNPAEQSLFLQLVRTGPGVLGFKPVKGTYYEKHFNDEAQALALIAANCGQADTWVSMATFSDSRTSRSQINAEGLRALWLDVDAHASSKYATVEEVEEALGDFINRTGLPKPTLINRTGYGVHAIWVFSEILKRESWQPVADRLQDLAFRMLLGADMITADAARILRVPGTLNFRDPEKPKLAIFQKTGDEALTFEEMACAIDMALAKIPQVAKTRGNQLSANKFDAPENKSNVALVNSMLSVISPDIGYSQWRDLVWSVAATGWNSAYELAYSWSERGKTWDEGAFNRVWSGFNASGGIGFGTLIFHAQGAGYAGPLPSAVQTKKLVPSGGLVTVCVADIEPEHIEWLVDESFPLGMLAVIGGQPGLGKSQISINLAAGVTTGKGLPGAGVFKDIGSVIILANEDDASRTIRPRLDAAGADISKIHIVEGVAREGTEVDMFQLDSDIADLRMRALQIGDVKLIIIDPPSAYLGTKVDSYKDSDVRGVLMPLTKLAQDTGAMILLIVHLNKRTDGGAQQRFSGSTAWTAAPRVGFMVAEDPVTKQRFMLPVKNNIGNDRLGYQYHIEEKFIRYGAQTLKSSFVVWDQTTNRTVADLLTPPKVNRVSVVDDAKTFLNDELAGGPQSVEMLKASAKAAGLSWPSVIRAKKELPIVSNKVGDGWIWTKLVTRGAGNV